RPERDVQKSDDVSSPTQQKDTANRPVGADGEPRRSRRGGRNRGNRQNRQGGDNRNNTPESVADDAVQARDDESVSQAAETSQKSSEFARPRRNRGSGSSVRNPEPTRAVSAPDAAPGQVQPEAERKATPVESRTEATTALQADAPTARQTT